jgi:hypothetical protein
VGGKILYVGIDKGKVHVLLLKERSAGEKFPDLPQAVGRSANRRKAHLPAKVIPIQGVEQLEIGAYGFIGAATSAVHPVTVMKVLGPV